MDVIGLLIVLAMSYAAGYVTRAHVSHKRRERARRWKDFAEPESLQPANSNEVIPAVPIQLGDLGRMLDRWESRARTRKLRASSP